MTHGGGCCFLYVNETDSKLYSEDIEFQLENLQIDGCDEGETKVKIEINAGEEKFIKLNKIDPSKGFSYG